MERNQRSRAWSKQAKSLPQPVYLPVLDMALLLAAKLAGQMTAQALQLAIEYDPTPPFDSVHRPKHLIPSPRGFTTRVRAKFVYADVHLTGISRQIP